ncbi:MAG: ribosome biogenesis GTPase Der [Candidatus Hydrothermales bacterium]
MNNLPFFVIVGKVNVGKSTLFNSIVGKNIAVTHSIPGVTRDVLRKKVFFDDFAFEICDTGGLFNSLDPLSEEVEKKILEVLDEADAFLFVVDAKEGLTEKDKLIMDMLRKKGKPIYLIINKIDVKEKKEEEFDELAINNERIFKISASHKIGISALIERLSRDFPFKGEKISRIPVVIIGRPNVGKSSILNSLIGKDHALVSPIPGTTRDPVEFEINEFIFIDTAGIKSKFNSDLEYFSYVKTSHSVDYALIVLFVMDVREPFTRIERKILSLIEEKGKGIIIILNKIDLLSKKEISDIYSEKRALYPYFSYIPHIFTSATLKYGIDSIPSKIKDVWKEMNREIKRSELKKFLLKAIKENSPPCYIKDIREISRIPRIYAVFSTDLLSNDYIRYLKNKFRKEFRFMGVPFKVFNKVYKY